LIWYYVQAVDEISENSSEKRKNLKIFKIFSKNLEKMLDKGFAYMVLCVGSTRERAAPSRSLVKCRLKIE
jgi:hypothetical protein